MFKPSSSLLHVAENIWRIITTTASIWLYKYAQIFVLGHYLLLEAHSFPRASLSEICSLLRTDNIRGQISEHIFVPNGGYCLFILRTALYKGSLNRGTTVQRKHAFSMWDANYIAYLHHPRGINLSLSTYPRVQCSKPAPFKMSQWCSFEVLGHTEYALTSSGFRNKDSNRILHIGNL